MGTSHRHKASVAGEPNWGKASQSVTSTAKAVEDGNKLEKNSSNMPPKQYARAQSRVNNRIRSNYHRSVSNMVRAAGGRSTVASGKSYAIGKSGVSWLGIFAGNLQDIQSKGLANWLAEHNETIDHKTSKDIIKLIAQISSDYMGGLDDTAAREAEMHVIELMEKIIGDKVDAIDQNIDKVLDPKMMTYLLDQYFGMYIFQHLVQDFSERIAKAKGEELSNQTFDEIKDLIMEDVRIGFEDGIPATEIDWKGQQGHEFITKEFNRILRIFSADDND